MEEETKWAGGGQWGALTPEHVSVGNLRQVHGCRQREGTRPVAWYSGCAHENSEAEAEVGPQLEGKGKSHAGI